MSVNRAETHRRTDGDLGARECQIRATAVVALVLFAHVAGIALVLSSRSMKLDAAPGQLPGASIAVSLVSQSAPSPVPAAPVAQPAREPAPPRPAKLEPAVRKAPHVVATRDPATRTVQKPEESVKAASQTSPPQTPQPAVVAPPAAATESTAERAANAQANSANSLALPKLLGADGLHQLGCQIPRPAFPAKAKRLQQAGTVLLRVTIGLDGRVTDAAVTRSSGYDLLDAAALDAIRAGSCKPYVENGHPRVVQATQAIAFSLDD